LEVRGDEVLVVGDVGVRLFVVVELLEGHFGVEVHGQLEAFGDFPLLGDVGFEQLVEVFDVREVDDRVEHVFEAVDFLVEQPLEVELVVELRPEGPDLFPGGLVEEVLDCFLEAEVRGVERGGALDFCIGLQMVRLLDVRRTGE